MEVRPRFLQIDLQFSIFNNSILVIKLGDVKLLNSFSKCQASVMATGCGFCAVLNAMSSTLWCSHTWLFTEVTSKVLGHLGDVCPVYTVAYGVKYIYIYTYIYITPWLTA